MIWRIRERDVFARLSSEGRRARAGVLWCTFLHDPTAAPPRVAFAIGRAIGSSVVRNRVRRRLRAALSAEQHTPGHSSPGQLPPGFYLIGARPDIAALSFAQLSTDVKMLIGAVDKQLARPAPASSDS